MDKIAVLEKPGDLRVAYIDPTQESMQAQVIIGPAYFYLYPPAILVRAAAPRGASLLVNGDGWALTPVNYKGQNFFHLDLGDHELEWYLFEPKESMLDDQALFKDREREAEFDGWQLYAFQEGPYLQLLGPKDLLIEIDGSTISVKGSEQLFQADYYQLLYLENQMRAMLGLMPSL